jgi:hypothetical protein
VAGNVALRRKIWSVFTDAPGHAPFIGMKEARLLDFRISGVPLAPFVALFGLSDQDLAARGALRRIADKTPGFPCRVSLQEAGVGEPVLLLNYEHLSVASPYRSRHAIYVREYAAECGLDINEVPDVIGRRLLSVRGFDGLGMMLEADVVEGTKVTPLMQRWLDNPCIDYLHLHNAKAGCFAARVDRARSL